MVRLWLNYGQTDDNKYIIYILYKFKIYIIKNFNNILFFYIWYIKLYHKDKYKRIKFY